ncbi:MAG: PAS domain S-box protein [bacterium]
MKIQYNANEELVKELQELKKEHESLKALYEKNIQNQKLAEEVHRVNEQRWQFALEGAGIGVWDWNAKTSEVFYSHSWKEMLGYIDDEIGNILNERRKRLHPDDAKQCFKDLNEHFEKKTPFYQNEHRVLCKDGTYKWILDCGKVIEWASDGKPLRVIGTHSDISKYKQAETALIESVANLNAVFNATDESIFLLAADGTVLSMNHVASKRLGHPREEILGRNLFDVFPPDIASGGLPFLDRAMFNGQVVGYEDQWNNHWMNNHIFPIVNDYGHLVRLAVYSQDITERKKLEETLRESESMYRSLFENMNEGVSLHEVITDKHGRVIDFRFLDTNASYENHTGMKTVDVVGKTMREIKPFADTEMIKQYGQVAFTRIPISFEYYSKTFSRYLRVKAISTQNKRFATIFEDITENKKAADLLERTRKNYEDFFNTINEFLFILDEQGNIIYANSTVYDRLGYTKEELFGKSILIVHPADRRDEAGKIVGEMLSGLTEFCPIPVITKSGFQIPVETRVSHGYWDGKPAIFGVTKDISKVRLSEEKFSKLFHLNPSACGLSDLDTHQYIEVNEAFYTLLGFDKDDVIGKTASELGILTPETINEILLKADSNGNVTNAEADLIAKNCDIKQVLISAENIYVQDKKYRLTVVHDVTEFKRAGEVLKERESSLLQAQEIANLGSWDWDLITQKTTWSDNYFTILGIQPSAAEPSFGFFRKMVHPDDVHILDETHDTILKNKLPESFELRIIHPDGMIKTIQNNLLPVVIDDQVVKLKGVIIDITKRKQAEEEITHINEQLLKINAEKDKFFSIIAHDLRSPFNVFLGFTKLLANELTSFTEDETRKIALSLRNSATNLYSLLENLLEWSRIQQGLIPFNQEVICLQPVIIESSAIIMYACRKKGIEFTYDIPDNLNVFTDINMLRTVMRNLFSNAVKFTPRGGNIKVAARDTKNGMVEIYIKDTGIGMSPLLINDLFRLDTQTYRNGTDGEPSTGLGLVMCKDFIEKQGGNIWAESEEGKGSIFYFTIPHKVENGQINVIKNITSDAVEDNQIKNLKILIAEDDETSEMLIVLAVKRFSKTVLKVKTGDDAVETCRNNPDIDLVLMDINLLKMDGYEATRQIRQFNKEVVIIAQTAYVLSEDKERAIEAGCNDYISKPYSIALLIKLIEKHFKN